MAARATEPLTGGEKHVSRQLGKTGLVICQTEKRTLVPVNEDRLGDDLVGRDLLDDLVVGRLVNNDGVVGLIVTRT